VQVVNFLCESWWTDCLIGCNRMCKWNVETCISMLRFFRIRIIQLRNGSRVQIYGE
jgi:hypothetical protein